MHRRNTLFLTLLLMLEGAAFGQPVITLLDPNFRPVGDPAFTMAVSGAGFVSGSVVYWEATALATTFINGGQLRAVVPVTLYQGVIGVQYFNISVMNPGGVRSAPVRFQVLEPFRLNSLSPPSAVAGGPQFILTATGSGFTPDLYLVWGYIVPGTGTQPGNGLPLATTFMSHSTLQAVVPAYLISAPATLNVAVYRPGAGYSVPVAFSVIAPQPPAVGALSPSSATAGGAQFTLTVYGSSFDAGSRVRWNGAVLDSTFVSGTQLTATVPAALIAAAGNAAITVVDSKGAASAPVYFQISCSYRIAAAGGAATAAVVAASGGTGSISISAGAGCAWTAASSASWLTISGTASGSGAGVVNYIASANTGPARNTVVVIAGQNFTVNQLSAKLPPVIKSVVNGADLESPAGSGTWLSIFGTDLSSTKRLWDTSDFNGDRLPTQLDGVGVKINGKPAYVYYIDSTQVNVLAPEDAAEGTVLVELTNPFGSSNLLSVEKRKISPAFFTLPVDGHFAAAVFDDAVLVGKPGLFGTAAATRPAKPGDSVAFYATGLGPTIPACPDGQIVKLPAPLQYNLSITIGGAPAAVDWAGLVVPGEYQINLHIPPDVPDGDAVPVVAETQGRKFVEVFIPVHR